ncbi:MAG: HIT domain-containing protein, partial [Candidatus Aenigmatarchaeota archaeon]
VTCWHAFQRRWQRCVISWEVFQEWKSNIGINLGKIAGASISHLHFHVVPRYGSDAGFVEIISSTKVMPEPLEKTYKKLRKYFQFS